MVIAHTNLSGSPLGSVQRERRRPKWLYERLWDAAGCWGCWWGVHFPIFLYDSHKKLEGQRGWGCWFDLFHCMLFDIISEFIFLHFDRLLSQQPSASDNCGPLQWIRPQHWLWQLCGQPDPLRVNVQWVCVFLTTFLSYTAMQALCRVIILSLIYRNLQDPGQGWFWSDRVGFSGGKSRDVIVMQKYKAMVYGPHIDWCLCCHPVAECGDVVVKNWRISWRIQACVEESSYLNILYVFKGMSVYLLCTI